MLKAHFCYPDKCNKGYVPSKKHVWAKRKEYSIFLGK